MNWFPRLYIYFAPSASWHLLAGCASAGSRHTVSVIGQGPVLAQYTQALSPSESSASPLRPLAGTNPAGSGNLRCARGQ